MIAFYSPVYGKVRLLDETGRRIADRDVLQPNVTMDVTDGYIAILGYESMTLKRAEVSYGCLELEFLRDYAFTKEQEGFAIEIILNVNFCGTRRSINAFSFAGLEELVDLQIDESSLDPDDFSRDED